MKRLLTLLLLTSGLLSVTPLSYAAGIKPSSKEQTEEEQPFYLYQGDRIPLQVRHDAIAVAFKPQAATRGDVKPQYLQLQEALKSGTRSVTATVQISPLGQQYAIAQLPAGIRSGTTAIENRIAQQDFVETTLPVLSSPGQSETIILNDELIVSFEPGISDAEQDRILAEQGAEIIRPMLLSKSRFVVRTTQTRGLGALEVANALAAVPGVNSVSPNFVQEVTRSPLPDLNSLDSASQLRGDLNLESGIPVTRGVGEKSMLLPWQWHISSVPILSCLGQRPESFSELTSCMKPDSQANLKINRNLQRTDLYVPEAWRKGQQGKGAIVAVIDSLIQWDHPALRKSLHRVTDPNRCEGELFGWDFSSLTHVTEASTFCNSGDGETRMDREEFKFIRWRLKQALAYSDEELLDEYAVTAIKIRIANPGVSDQAIAAYLRKQIQSNTSAEFHGTSVSSVIASNTSESFGMIGVAPQAQILPVRVMGMNNSMTEESLLVGLLYAAHRGADVINISLGTPIPTDTSANVIAEILEKNPELVIVAASGNSDNDRPNYPAAFPGVLSVGATNLLGQRAPYSSFGSTMDVVAPGGDLSDLGFGGLLVAGGTWVPELWTDIPGDRSISDLALDNRGTYFFTQGTSFASPAVAGVVALMKGEDPQRLLDRSKLTAVLKGTTNEHVVSLTDDEWSAYQQAFQGKAADVEAEAKAYFFGEGLVNADRAVGIVKQLIEAQTR